MICLFNKKSVGIDIADHRIWVTRLAKTKGIPFIDTLGGVKLKPGVVVDGRIKDKKALATAINKLMDNIKAESSCEKRIVFGLPKNQSYVHIFSDETGNRNKNYLEQIVKKNTEESIPIEINNLYYTYKIIEKKLKKTKLLVIAVSKEVLREWQDFFTSIGVDVQVYDLGSLATFRNLYKKPPKKPLCMIDIGGDATSITVFDSRGLRYSHAIKVAGIKITSQIAKDLNISVKEAEKLKLKNGLKADDKVAQSIKTALKPIIKTTKEIFDYIKTKTEEDLEKIILVGGASLLKGLPAYIESEVGVKVELGKPLITKGKTGFEHINSIGLALRGLESRTKQKDPGLSPLKKEKKTKIERVAKRAVLSDIENETGAEAMSFDDMEEAKKLKKQKRMLLIILFLGVVLVGLSFLYRHNETIKKQQGNPGEMGMFNNLENLTLQIPIAVYKDEYTTDRVKGRITESFENKLKSGEKLWLDPVALSPARWLIYSEDEAQALLLAKIKNDYTTDFSLNNIVYKAVSSTDNKNVYLLKAGVSIYTAEPLNINVAIAPEKIANILPVEEIVDLSSGKVVTEIKESKDEPRERLIVTESPYGWVNVRSGAGTSFSILGKAYTGEEYNIIKKGENWTEIDFGEDDSGWIYNNYIKIL